MSAIVPAIFAHAKKEDNDPWEQLTTFQRPEPSRRILAFSSSMTVAAAYSGSVAWAGSATGWAGPSRDWFVSEVILSKTMIAGEYAAVVYDHNRQPHSVNGVPAVKYSDGGEEFYWHGVKVPEFVARRPEEIRTDMIEAEDNAEIRRVMIERYGLQRFMADCGAVRIHKDECGELYKKNMGQGEEPIVFVKVKNSTPEPDGSIKDYFLRVPPATKKARDGIAWTFNIDPKDYRPELQT